jgi:formate dehydrogenase iron-sulfur subunit
VKTPSLLDELLAEQQQLTAVDRFSQRHDQHPERRSKYYQDLMPLERPGAGQQYAFRVDLDSCTGCKACVSACHSLNGLDENETWRSVGLLHGGSPTEPYQQTVTTACHHCLEPACLEGCPVLAYEKDEATGIVRHLADQCIGCQYCVLKCPYDVPKYSSKRGIVRKCDMCHGRLAEEEPPACVQACPSGAISIQVISKEDIARDCVAPEQRLLPGAFPSEYTQPTTSYVSRKPFPQNCEPADATTLRLEPAHWSLVWMLVLTQTAAGMFLAAALAVVFQTPVFAATKPALSVCGFVALLAGLLSSVFHLGRPIGAWRALLGLRRSWMSREILAFILFALSAASAVALNWVGNTAASLSVTLIAATFGILSVFCSAMIYVDTRRPAWSGKVTFPRFFGTALLMAASGAAVVYAWSDLRFAAIGSGSYVHGASSGVVVLQAGLLCLEIGRLIGTWSDPRALVHVPALLTWRMRKRMFLVRVALSVLSMVCALVAASTVGAFCFWAALAAFLSTFGSQIAERYLFFVTAAAPKMPGSFSQ